MIDIFFLTYGKIMCIKKNQLKIRDTSGSTKASSLTIDSTFFDKRGVMLTL
ncbi:hypothetical protein [Peribacillus frigoritolerans]|uniref:hypothetical protein n=1 Tax=Peribacillus frigoritolerans TaxID=450367 RepID=UPI00140502AC|nr:hypothetical protein [Peribacillus frigoritolerans]